MVKRLRNCRSIKENKVQNVGMQKIIKSIGPKEKATPKLGWRKQHFILAQRAGEKSKAYDSSFKTGVKGDTNMDSLALLRAFSGLCNV